MIPNELFLKLLQELDVRFYTGVPDSLLKHFCACVSDLVKPEDHIITANEGAAVALAAGHHLATGNIPLVYMQNSGLGNSVNPLLSLADSEVYGIPMLLMIGWRGEPGRPDEPQHVKQGRVQSDMLNAMDIPFKILGPDTHDYELLVRDLLKRARDESRPVSLVIRRDTFGQWEGKEEEPAARMMTREEALALLVHATKEHDILVSTTGMPSRELFEIRAKAKMGHHRDFLTVGSMGHCSQIALGLAKAVRDRMVYCLDGDGSVIMHMGSLAIIGQHAPSNFKHVVFNNGAHDSVGGQQTVGLSIDIPAIASACGYRDSRRVQNREEMESGLEWLAGSEGPVLLEVQVGKGARGDLGRPDRTPLENKKDFMRNIRDFPHHRIHQ